jgi:hypothetical protein
VTVRVAYYHTPPPLRIPWEGFVLIDRQTAVLKLNCQLGSLMWVATAPANNETLVCVHVCVCVCQ